MTHDKSKSSAQAIQALQGVLILEITPILPAEAAGKAAFLTKEAAGVLATQIADDLEQLFPGLRQAGIILPGAVYDQTELLIPGFTLYRALEEMYVDACDHGQFEAHIISLGSVDGEFPLDALRPAPAPMWGPLLAIPFSLIAPESILDPIAADFDDRLFDQGTCSEATQAMVKQQFGVTIQHAQYLSLGGLCALTRAHLGAAGLDFLWQLLEMALIDPHGSTEVSFDVGLICSYDEHKATLPFLTYSAWVAVAENAADRPVEQGLAEGYSNYLRLIRQAAIGLTAHGISVDWQIGDYAVREGSVVSEMVVMHLDPASKELPSIIRATLTEQCDRELGSVAWVVAEYDEKNQVIHQTSFYPLTPDGLKPALEAAESHAAHFPSVTQRQTDSLEITADGQHLLDA